MRTIRNRSPEERAHSYSDVFPKELPGMPPDRDIEFIIDLIPGAGPIAKRPYNMDVDELKELKKKLKEQLDKGFIQRSSSPWGAPVLWVEKKDRTQRLVMDYRSPFVSCYCLCSVRFRSRGSTTIP